MAKDRYHSFRDLAAGEKRGEDYDIEWRRKNGSSVAVIAPHGGNIEPWTGEIADAIAGNDFSFYCFKGLKPTGGLHITSHLFDEPTCVELITAHRHVVSIHGWAAKGGRVCVGGRDSILIAALKRRLASSGIQVDNAEGGLSGCDPNNIVNRGATGRGVQFELTMGFRTNAAATRCFGAAVRAVLLDAQGTLNLD